MWLLVLFLIVGRQIGRYIPFGSQSRRPSLYHLTCFVQRERAEIYRVCLVAWLRSVIG